jgi:hypothetical protein
VINYREAERMEEKREEGEGGYRIRGQIIPLKQVELGHRKFQL